MGRLLVHKGFPLKNVKAIRTKSGLDITSGKTVTKIPVPEKEATISAPEIGATVPMRFVHGSGVFWLAGQRIFKEEKKRKGEKQKEMKKKQKQKKPAAKSEEKKLGKRGTVLGKRK